MSERAAVTTKTPQQVGDQIARIATKLTDRALKLSDDPNAQGVAFASGNPGEGEDTLKVTTQSDQISGNQISVNTDDSLKVTDVASFDQNPHGTRARLMQLEVSPKTRQAQSTAIEVSEDGIIAKKTDLSNGNATVHDLSTVDDQVTHAASMLGAVRSQIANAEKNQKNANNPTTEPSDFEKAA